MPSVGERKKSIGNFESNPMHKYAATFLEATQNILREDQVDYAFEPAKALAFDGAMNTLKDFFVEGSIINQENKSHAEIQDEIDMMNEVFINDVQAVRENATMGMASYNPLIGISLPMHKYLMMNCMFAQALPRYVAKSPAWTETMETRWMVTPDGRKIDIANQQNEIFNAWKSANKPIEVALALPEMSSVDILGTYFKVPKTSHNLSVATHICAVAVPEKVKTGDPIVKIESGKAVDAEAEEEGVALVWKPWKAEFNPGYGEYNRVLQRPVDMMVINEAGEEELFHDFLFASQKDNMFEINSSGKIKAVKLLARYDASSRQLKTNRVEWSERSTFVQIPESDGITVPITPEEVKDIGALYGINQVTKYMSTIKDILENVKDDDIKEYLYDSYDRLDDDHRLSRAIDFAPPKYYNHSYIQWMRETFMDTLDQYVTGLLTVLRDPNMKICIIGRPALIRRVTPVEYTYSAPSNVGPIELSFTKTVVTSDKREYVFLSSDKLWGRDELLVLLIPKNTNRIVYRLYDYQMYISNEIRDAENPSLPALTSFQRYKVFEFQPVQGRISVINPSGLREHYAPIEYADRGYANNDLQASLSHYDKTLKMNVATPNAEID